METFLQDVRYGFRLLWKSPVFTVVSVITLALGIGANTALFSVVNSVILRPLPFPDSSRLAMVWASLPKLNMARIPVAPSDFNDYVQAQKSFENMAIFENQNFDITGNGDPERVVGARVSAALFPVLGIQPMLGRTFVAEEDQPGQEQVAVLGYSLWQQRYGSDRSIVGKNINLNRQAYRVIGVMPRSFEFPLQGPSDNHEPAQIFVPAAFTSTVLQMRGAMYQYSVVGRLNAGVSIATAQSEARTLGLQIEKNYPPEVLRAFHNADLGFVMEPYHTAVAGEVRKPMLIMLGAVILVLLIACANVANLLVVRGAARQRELAIRAAVGADRTRLLRQLLTESLVLAVVGSAFGVILAIEAKDLLVHSLPPSVPHPATIELSGSVFGFAFLLCFIAALIFGLVAATESSRISLQQTLQENTMSGTAVQRRRRLQGFFVIGEFALALGLLVGAGLLLRSFSKLLKTDPGFQPDHALSLSVSLPREAYSQPDQIRNFYRELVARVQELPGVQAAGLSSDLPLWAQETEMIHEIDGRQVGPPHPGSGLRGPVVGQQRRRTLGRDDPPRGEPEPRLRQRHQVRGGRDVGGGRGAPGRRHLSGYLAGPARVGRNPQAGQLDDQRLPRHERRGIIALGEHGFGRGELGGDTRRAAGDHRHGAGRRHAGGGGARPGRLLDDGPAARRAGPRHVPAPAGRRAARHRAGHHRADRRQQGQPAQPSQHAGHGSQP